MMQNSVRLSIFIFVSLLLVLLSGNFFFFHKTPTLTKNNNNMSFQVLLREGIVGGFAGPTVK